MSEPFSPKGSRRRMAFSSDLLEAARPDFRARGFLLRYGLEDGAGHRSAGGGELLQGVLTSRSSSCSHCENVFQNVKQQDLD
jgi:hypothetical protein